MAILPMSYENAIGHARQDAWSTYSVHGDAALEMGERRWREFRQVYPHCADILAASWVRAYRAAVREMCPFAPSFG